MRIGESVQALVGDLGERGVLAVVLGVVVVVVRLVDRNEVVASIVARRIVVFVGRLVVAALAEVAVFVDVANSNVALSANILVASEGKVVVNSSIVLAAKVPVVSEEKVVVVGLVCGGKVVVGAASAAAGTTEGVFRSAAAGLVAEAAV